MLHTLAKAYNRSTVFTPRFASKKRVARRRGPGRLCGAMLQDGMSAAERIAQREQDERIRPRPIAPRGFRGEPSVRGVVQFG